MMPFEMVPLEQPQREDSRPEEDRPMAERLSEEQIAAFKASAAEWLSVDKFVFVQMVERLCDELSRVTAERDGLLARNEEIVNEKAAERDSYERRINRMCDHFRDLEQRMRHVAEKSTASHARGVLSRAAESAKRFSCERGTKLVEVEEKG